MHTTGYSATTPLFPSIQIATPFLSFRDGSWRVAAGRRRVGGLSAGPQGGQPAAPGRVTMGLAQNLD